MPDRQVVILGAGFGGLYAALHLERVLRRERSVRIVLLDKENYHLFVPMLHEITSGSVEPRHVVRPLRPLFRKTRVDFRRAGVRSIDLEGRRVLTDLGELAYDDLVIALGSTTNFFGVEGVEAKTFTFKTLEDAVRLRNHLLEMFERADLEPDPKARRRLLTFCLVGAGCTGVELATELQDLIQNTLLPNYPRLDGREVRLVLPEASGRIIPCVSNRLAWRGLDKLRRKGRREENSAMRYGQRKMLIRGEWHAGAWKKVFSTIDPGNGEVLAEVARSYEEDVQQAVGAAQNAFEHTEWASDHPARPPTARSRSRAASTDPFQPAGPLTGKDTRPQTQTT